MDADEVEVKELVTERVGLAVYIQSLKQVKQLKRFGHVHYASKKMKYVILYCDLEDADETVEKLERMPFVKQVLMSMRPWIKTEYQGVGVDTNKEKHDDYKMGL
nr:YlbG family protein [Alkalicoccus halolimnae]